MQNCHHITLLRPTYYSTYGL